MNCGHDIKTCARMRKNKITPNNTAYRINRCKLHYLDDIVMITAYAITHLLVCIMHFYWVCLTFKKRTHSFMGHPPCDSQEIIPPNSIWISIIGNELFGKNLKLFRLIPAGKVIIMCVHHQSVSGDRKSG